MAQIKRLGFGLQAIILLAWENDYMTSADIAGRIRCEPTALGLIGRLCSLKPTLLSAWCQVRNAICESWRSQEKIRGRKRLF